MRRAIRPYLPPLLAALAGCVLVTGDDLDAKIGEIEDRCTWYTDSDGDGWGVEELPLVDACGAPPPGASDRVGDCNDANDRVHPEAEETCNEVDDDCDGAIDEGLPTQTWYGDADRDGWGAPDVVLEACAVPGGSWSSNNEDCDDADADVHPGAEEVCNGVDDDCDDEVDEGLEQVAWHADADGDGYGDPDVTTESCGPPGTDWVADDTDCYDANADAHPGQVDYFDVDRGDGSFDYDCDGTETLEIAAPTSCSAGRDCLLDFPGWSQTVPNCGETGVYVESCEWKSLRVCSAVSYDRTQRCR